MKALITGIDGQDGSYLTEFLLNKKYEVHGLLRRNVNPMVNIKHLQSKIHIHYGDMANENRLCVILNKIKPDEVYNLAGQSDVRVSFDIPEYTGDITGLGVTRLLEAIRYFSPHSKVYQASSSEMFGSTPPPQNELTPLKARSPYGAAKIYAHNLSINYREAYNLFVCCGILFNLESERRGLRFVTRKISNAVARIALLKQDTLELGNMDSKRDWGYAPDYIEAMWLMLQQDKPSDYVIGTGVAHSVRDFVIAAFDYIGWDWQRHVKSNSPEDMRPSEVNLLLADTSKAKKELGWIPKTQFNDLVKIMVDHDLEVNK